MNDDIKKAVDKIFEDNDSYLFPVWDQEFFKDLKKELDGDEVDD